MSLEFDDSLAIQGIVQDQTSKLSYQTKTGKTSFRMQTSKLALTYSKRHISKQALEASLRSLWPDNEIKELFIAHEMGDNKDNPHTQVAVWWSRRLDVTNCRVFDWVDGDPQPYDHPWLAPIGNYTKQDKLQWLKYVRYLGKEDPENEHLKHYMKDDAEKMNKDASSEKHYYDLMDRVEQQKTLSDALRCASSCREVQAIKTIFESRVVQVPYPAPRYQPFAWQQELITEFTTLVPNPDNKRVVCIVDPSGQNGKSELRRWLYAELGNKLFWCDEVGNRSDLPYQIVDEFQKGLVRSVFVFDMARANHSFLMKPELYLALEKIQNGFVTSTKYKGGSASFECQHTVLLVNDFPDVLQMSEKRWDVRELVPGKSQESKDMVLVKRPYQYVKQKLMGNTLM